MPEILKIKINSGIVKALRTVEAVINVHANPGLAS